MIIETKAACRGVFFVSLQDADFRRNNKAGNWRTAIGHLKNDIPSDQRSYDKDTRQWEIKDTPDNRDIIAAINDVFFRDENQEELF